MNESILILVGLVAVLMTSLWYFETQKSERYKESEEEWKKISHKWFKLAKESIQEVCKQKKKENGCTPTKYAKVTLKTGDVYLGIHDSKSTDDVIIIIQDGCECKSFRAEEIEDVEFAMFGTPLHREFNVSGKEISQARCGWRVDGGALNTVIPAKEQATVKVEADTEAR